MAKPKITETDNQYDIIFDDAFISVPKADVKNVKEAIAKAEEVRASLPAELKQPVPDTSKE